MVDNQAVKAGKNHKYPPAELFYIKRMSRGQEKNNLKKKILTLKIAGDNIKITVWKGRKLSGGKKISRTLKIE